MPTAPARRCPFPSCGNKQPCKLHGNYRSPQAKEWQHLYNAQWRRYRLAFLAEYPLCADPFRDHGPYVAAECVDHIKPHRGNVELFWSSTNHQALCTACNSKKAAKFEGGFGNR